MKKYKILVPTIIVLGFVITLSYFHIFDIYDFSFFRSGVTAPYNLFRMIFIIYLFGAICVPGAAVLLAIGGAATVNQLRPLARLAGSFFCGAALWHALLLLLGFLNLYTYPVAVVLSLSAVALAPVFLGQTLRDLYGNTRAALRFQPPLIARTSVVLAGGVLAAALLLLLVKGLFPAGGHDYFNHYHGYYESVLRNHGIWPNEVWYQFYYSKGMGLFYLAMILTDPLAPSLVTYCFALATAIALFLLIDRMLPGASFWPLIAVIAYFVFYTYTPGIDVYLLNGGWADFEKPHEINAAFVIAFLWLFVELHCAGGRERRIWFFAAGACLFIIGIVELVTVLLLGLFTTLMTIGSLFRRHWNEAKVDFAMSFIGGCGFAAVLALNYAVTGLPSDQLVIQMWPWVNVQTLNKWGALPDVIMLIPGLEGLRAQSVDWFSWRFVAIYHDFLRFDLLKPLLIKTWLFSGLLLGVTVYRVWRPHREQNTTALTTLLVFFVALAGVAAFSSGQRISFYRYSSFCLPAMIGLAGCGWLYIVAPIRIQWLSRAGRYVLPIVLLVGAVSQFWHHQMRFLKLVIPNALAFADGSLSIRQAYAHQQGWAGRQSWGGIFPGMVGAWEIAGPETRIWSMHLGAYCMLPHCRSETFYSFMLSPNLLDILAGSAEETRDILQREHLDYFFYTTAMDVNDILPLTKPFAPDSIGQYIGVQWTDGTSYLLTWLGPGVSPLTPEWVARYKKSVDSAPYQPVGFPLGLMLALREQLRSDPKWGSELKIPGVTSN